MNEQINEIIELDQISRELASIKDFLEKEMGQKQDLIQKLTSDTESLKKVIAEKNTEIAALHTKLHEIQQASEGNRQIINKLLNDISHYQKDINWYKWTYEKRSFLGVLREKLFRKR